MCLVAASAAITAGSTAEATRLGQNGELQLQGPGLRVAVGGAGLGGLGTVSASAELSVTIEGPVRKAFLYWAGRGVLPGDASIIVEGSTIDGVLIGSEVAPAATSYAYRADVTELVKASITPPGTLTWSVADPTPGEPKTTLDGASLFVVYDDPGDSKPYQLTVFEGSDFAYAPNLPAPSGFTEPVGFVAVPEEVARTGQLFLIVGDAYPTRPDRIEISGNPDVIDQLDASDGNQLDSDIMEIELAANTNRLTVQLVSPPEAGPVADSMNWVLAALLLPVEGTSDGFTGACCLEDGLCLVLSLDGCNTLGGAFQGPSTLCAPNPCPQPTGACCLTDGSCVLASESACFALDGTYQGDDTACTPELCVPATGACCMPTGACEILSAVDCITAGGDYRGDATDCATVTCPDPIGACCFRDGTCGVGLAFDCMVTGGDYQGDFTVCETVDCVPVTGACCMMDASCLETTAVDCAMAGGAYEGDGVACAGVLCPGTTGACCLPDGSCVESSDSECAASGGTYQGNHTTCDAVSCPQPVGACCFVNGSCGTSTEQGCDSLGGTYQGNDTDCSGVDCPQPPGACCFPDGTCAALTEAECDASGGNYQGNFVLCVNVKCPEPFGACCFENGTCKPESQSECEDAGGEFQGGGTICDYVECPKPSGACCLEDGACINTSKSICEAMGGDYQGDGTTCAEVDCPLPTGACCLEDGSCVEVTGEDCAAMNGDYQGDGTTCAEVECPQPTGACCLEDGTCINALKMICGAMGGDYQGNGTTCDAVDCPLPTGACCLEDGSCVEFTADECTAMGGDYQGDSSRCTAVDCPQPNGACCLADGSCVEVTEEQCKASGGDFQGDFSTCATVDCPQPNGACCLADGSCVEVTEEQCKASGGDFQGDFSTCTAVDCPQPNGACCLDDGSCVEVTEEQCDAASGEFEGDFTSCLDVECPQPVMIGACCLEDGSCIEVTEDECAAAGGRFQGKATMCADVVCPRPGGGGCTEKGSLLVFSKIDVRWDAKGRLIQDTFVDISNDYPEDVRVLMYFINGDPPMEKCDKVDEDDKDGLYNCDSSDEARRHPGWNWIDNEIMLTKNEPAYWSAATGLPKGVSPWSVLDPGPPPGRPADDGTGDRVLRGYILAWAVDAENQEIRWNHLKGDALILNYRHSTAWEYNACAYAVVDPTVANGELTGTPGVLNLDGAEYAPVYEMLLMDFYGADSMALSGPHAGQSASVQTDLTLHVMDADLRQETDGPVTTKAHFDVWNMNEVKFSGAYRCITCWDQTLLRDYDVPNHFLRSTLQTDKGKARIDGLASQLCDFDNDPKDQKPIGASPLDIVSRDAALMGVVAKYLMFSSGPRAAAGTNLHGMGTEAATIRFDTLEIPPELVGPREFLHEILRAIDDELRPSPRP